MVVEIDDGAKLADVFDTENMFILAIRLHLHRRHQMIGVRLGAIKVVLGLDDDSKRLSASNPALHIAREL